MAPIKVDIWGNLALFTRPEMKVERVSYDIITPSAARNILTSILWHPGMIWVIRSIQVCNPVSFINVKRNEISNVGSAKNILEAKRGKISFDDVSIDATSSRSQRSSRILKNVRYIIEAEIEMTEDAYEGDTAGKFYSMVTRRIKKGQYYRRPYLGCREFPCNFRLYDENEVIECPPDFIGEVDLGYMLYDLDYRDKANVIPCFFRAVLHNGKLIVPSIDSPEIVR